MTKQLPATRTDRRPVDLVAVVAHTLHQRCIAHAERLTNLHPGLVQTHHGADTHFQEAEDVVEALAPHVVPRTKELEWGVQYHGGEVDESTTEAGAREVASWHDSRSVVHRYPAGPWTKEIRDV